MQVIPVHGELGRYDVHVGESLLQGLGEGLVRCRPSARIAVLAFDQAIEATWAAEAASSLEAAGLRVVRHPVRADEANKSIAEVERLWRRMAQERVQRSDALCALGGGIVGDMAAFAAATYQRGIATVMVPTTLLAMVDAAIGGKTAVNLAIPGGGLVKNLAGSFTAPIWVLADVRTLSTLPPREFRCGLAECVKHALLADPALLDWIASSLALLESGDAAPRVELVCRSARVKAAIVSRDERESGERAHLNLGHTFGHAIESILHQELHHGEAVAIGLVAMAAASEAAGWWPGAGRFDLPGRLRALRLPVRLPKPVDREAVKAAMRLDKKGKSGETHLVLLRGPGHPGVLPAASPQVVDAGLGAIGA